MKIECYRADKLELYKVNLSTPFFVTKIKEADGYFVWTSIPQGMQNLAEIIGGLIEESLGNAGKSSEQQSLF